MLRARTKQNGTATLVPRPLLPHSETPVPLVSLAARRAAPGAIICHHYVVPEDHPAGKKLLQKRLVSHAMRAFFRLVSHTQPLRARLRPVRQ